MTKRIKLKISSRLVKKRFRKNGLGKKQCRFFFYFDQVAAIDYKNASFLRGFLTERGKILPSRISGMCDRHQRSLSLMIKRSRVMALLPYTSFQS